MFFLFFSKQKTNNLVFFLYNLIGDIIKEFLEDNTFSLIIKKNYINIINFIKILVLDDDKVTLELPNNNITIIGKELKLLKLLDNEVLIKGIITNIEFR